MFTYVATSSFLQYQFIENGFKRTEDFEHSGMMLLFLFTLDDSLIEMNVLDMFILLHASCEVGSVHAIPVTNNGYVGE